MLRKELGVGKKNKQPNKSKKQRQLWWNSLSSDEQGEQIKKWQARKAERRRLNPVKPQTYNPKYPWATNGVNPKNKERWLRMLYVKNPWMRDASIFEQMRA